MGFTIQIVDSSGLWDRSDPYHTEGAELQEGRESTNFLKRALFLIIAAAPDEDPGSLLYFIRITADYDPNEKLFWDAQRNIAIKKIEQSHRGPVLAEGAESAEGALGWITYCSKGSEMIRSIVLA